MGNVSCLICVWLTLKRKQVYIGMRLHHEDRDRRFNVKYIFWPEFLHTILRYQDKGDSWQKLASADCLFGGVDMGMSYM
jgi:hypothetical protein